MSKRLKLLSLAMGALSSLQMILPLSVYSADPKKTDENSVSQKANEDLSAIEITSENVNELNKAGYAPLHLQVQEDNLGAVEFLISKGADVSIKDKNGDTPLHTAAREDAIECLIYLISKGADIEAKNSKGETPLMIAAKAGNNLSFSALLGDGLKEKRADINTVDDKNNTVLHYLAGSDMDGLVSILSSAEKDDYFSPILKMVNKKNDDGESPLFNAIRSRNEDVAMLLIENGALNISNKNGQTPLMLAAQYELKGLVIKFIEMGMNIEGKDNDGNTFLHYVARCWNGSSNGIFSNSIGSEYKNSFSLKLRKIINVANNNGTTPLIIAAFKDQSELAECLIKNGADVNVEDKYRNTPLLNAAAKDKYELTRLLIENGAMIIDYNSWPLYIAVRCCCGFEVVKLLFDSGFKFNTKDCGAALFQAVENNDFRLAKCLIENGADVNFEAHSIIYLGTPIYVAVRNNSFELAKLLIENGADVSFKDERDRTLLHIAARCYDFKTAKELIEKGVDIEAESRKKGPIPFDITWGRYNFDMVKLLIEYGADVNAKDSDGSTPLLYAMGSMKSEIAKILIENGADVNAKNSKGQTPLHGAVERKNYEESKLLIENGADVNAKDNKGQIPLDIATDPQIISLLEEAISK